MARGHCSFFYEGSMLLYFAETSYTSIPAQMLSISSNVCTVDQLRIYDSLIQLIPCRNDNVITAFHTVHRTVLAGIASRNSS